MRFIFLLYIYITISFSSFGQIGGNNTFEFLNLVPSARSAALGGNAIAVRVDDVSLVWQNPAQLSKGMDRQLQLSFADYFEGINFGQASYAHDIKNFGMCAATLHYINYGTFKMTDETSEEMGTFSAGEYALGLSWSKALDSLLYVGVTLKGIYSDLESYTSWGVTSDVGLTYFSKDHFFCASIVAKNVGRQLGQYDESGRERVPFEMQIGLMKQLPKAPFRFGLTWQHLEKFAITYDDPSIPDIDPLTGESNSKKIPFFDKCMRHIVLNTELLLSKNFNVRLGYNFQRRAEMSIENKRGLLGLSGGFGFKVSKFQLSYARVLYHIKGSSNQFAVAIKISDLHKGKRLDIE